MLTLYQHFLLLQWFQQRPRQSASLRQVRTPKSLYNQEMLNKDEIDGVAKAAAEIVKAVPVYDDALKPVAKEVGKALGTLGGVINIALSPLAAMVYGFEVIKEQLTTRLEARLTHTPPENIVAPPLQLVGPLIEKYKYVHDSEELSQMFVNLLANSMDKDTAQKAHPSFVNIISELSPDEARLLKTISTESILPKLDITLNHKTPENRDAGHTYISENFTHLGTKAKLQYPDLTSSYLSNLERLNIISCPVGMIAESYTEKTHYKSLREDSLVTNLQEKYKKEGKEVELHEGIIRITDYGKLFIDAVLAPVRGGLR